MHKLFDKLMVGRISEVFQNHQEAYNSDDWENLYAKMKHKKRTVAIWRPLISKAATIALFLGLSVFSVNDIEKNYENKMEVVSSIENEAAPEKDKAYKQILLEGITKNQKSVLVLSNENTKKEEIAESNPQSNIMENKDGIYVKTDSISNFDSSGLQLVEVKKDIDKRNKEIKKIDLFIQDSTKNILLDDDPEFIIADSKKNNKQFDFGVEVASVSNYASEGEGSSFNVGGGISTAWNLTNKISFSTGLILAHQSMNYNQNQSSEKLVETKNAMYAAPNSLEMVDVNTAESTVEFIGIDIPLNIQFRHNRFILTTGLSSLLYVQEKYSYSYSSIVKNTKYNSSSSKFETQNSVNQVEMQEKSEIFNRFDFARLLNLAVGYKIPLSKGDLVFEPYVKLPIGNISSYEIKMGSGGFALRYNF